AKGAKTLIVGVANRGGIIGGAWLDTILKALDLGMDIAAGLHQRLADVPEIAARANALGRTLWDVRHPPQAFAVASGKPRVGRRLLAVGTDCSVGKMYTTLAIEKDMKARGMNVDFRATGQTGIFIAGGGVSVDAVVADFISGAVEWLAPENTPDHWDVIEGQGSLFHASYAGVSLGLIHGAQPDALVLCHDPVRDHMRGIPHQPLPNVKACMDLNLMHARLVNPKAQFVGICLNTSAMKPEAAAVLKADLAKTFDLPCIDPLKDGVGTVVDRLVTL
ncbi:MAG: DUF1611 domain-containing protein, partial [Rhodospirillaceae bacterium]|nr:DUF1611 domain-containing protein [Rhodospirillaceae bacterium]